jgi:hypothetical protein
LKEKDEHSRNVDKRLKEIKKQDTELGRREKVVAVKKAGKRIEDIDRTRKRPTILSIIRRIESFIKLLKKICESSLKSKHMNAKIPAVIKSIYQKYGDIYESILYDFQKNLKLKDTDM